MVKGAEAPFQGRSKLSRRTTRTASWWPARSRRTTALEGRGLLPASALLAVRDDAVPALAGRDPRYRAALQGLARRLPLALAAPDAVLLDAAAGTLVYAWRQADGRYALVLVQLGQDDGNLVRAGNVVPRTALQARRYQLLSGALE